MRAKPHPLICIIVLLFVLAVTHATAESNENSKGDYVILVHGAGRNPISMKPMEAYFRAHGYRVINLQFKSAGRSLEQVAESSFTNALEGLDPHAKIHFVAHSMGAIIVRQYLAQHDVPNLGRIVMLGPPNHGSELVDRVKSAPLLRACLGQRVLELGTAANDLPCRLGPVRFECGVIAGDRSINLLSLFLFRGPNDGKVTVESARVDGMHDFLVVPVSHSLLIWDQNVFRQTAHYLKCGEFKRETVGYKPQNP